MKKLLVLLVIISLSLTSCSKPDIVTENPQINNPTGTAASTLVGKWRVEQIYLNNIAVGTSDCDKASTLDLYTNLSFDYEHHSPAPNNGCATILNQNTNRTFTYNGETGDFTIKYISSTGISSIVHGKLTNKMNYTFELELDFQDPFNTTKKRVRYRKI